MTRSTKVVAAEIAFARAAQEKGQWTAFAEYATDDAVMFVPEPVVARDWLRRQTDPPQPVQWQTHQVWSSCDGTLAVTKGAWQRPDGTPYAEELLLLEVLNVRSIGPNLVFGPDANPSDGYFDVVVAQESHRHELLTYLEDRSEGRDRRLALPTRRAREVVIERGDELHVDDERVQAYVARVGQSLAPRTELPNAQWTFTVLDSPTINAFATPGGAEHVQPAIPQDGRSAMFRIEYDLQEPEPGSRAIMPEAVEAYRQSRSLIDCARVQRDLLATLRDDFAKYAARVVSASCAPSTDPLFTRFE